MKRRLAAFAAELASTGDGGDELSTVVCACVTKLASTLKPAYAEALRQIEVDQISVKDYAAAAGISASNASVRIFRAREALRKQVARDLLLPLGVESPLLGSFGFGHFQRAPGASTCPDVLSKKTEGAGTRDNDDHGRAIGSVRCDAAAKLGLFRHAPVGAEK